MVGNCIGGTVVFVQIFSQIIVFVGAFDLVFDFRNLSGKRTSKRA